jgi:hypothetical protein
MRKLFALSSLLLVLVGGCDADRREFKYCDTTYSQCKYGYTCDFDAGLCVADVDAGIQQDAGVSDANGSVDLAAD